jgi:hypothetical protein
MTIETAGAFAGAAGVGALCVLGIFLMLDGMAADVLPTIEFYAKTATWGIVAAVPVLAITYVIGLLVVGGVVALEEWAVGGVVGIAADDVVRLAALANDSPVTQFYLQRRDEQGVLGGSAIGLLLLAAGAYAERRNLPEVAGVTKAAAVLAVVAAMLCLAGSVVKGREAHAVVRVGQEKMR